MEPERAPQIKIALRHCGRIEPENIDCYLARGGFVGLHQALKMTPVEVIEEVGRAGLWEERWHGLSVGEKWRTYTKATGSEKYMICNAAEGDPDSLTTRTLLEEDPISVLEGMLICAYATGATSGLIYINSEYTLAMSRLRTALKQMEDGGLPGNPTLDPALRFRIEVKEAKGNIACGDEAFLVNAIEDKKTLPFLCLSHPSIYRLGGKPTLIHQAETLSCISAILEKGAEWYASYGTEQCRGTKVLTLIGKVMCTGLIEVPMGTTLRSIVYDIGKGMPEGKRLKALQIGGPSGGYLPNSFLDLPIDYKRLTDAGTPMGTGTILVLDGDSCIVDHMKQRLSFIQGESCGKCTFCREGTRQMAEILADITEGRAKIHDMDMLLELGEGMKLGAQCDLGRTAANPALTALRYFREELEAHIKESRCEAGVCSKLERC